MRDGGTNALLCDARSPVPFQFGPQSAIRHQRASAAWGTPLIVRREAALEVDVDVMDDLGQLNPGKIGTATAKWLARHRSELPTRLATAEFL
jgi:2-phospho-L-lactate guanylyltransferase (CobY/MobA/RfbA family)